MSEFQIVNVWADAAPGAAAFSPMPPSMFWLPKDYSLGQQAPAFVFLPRWGGYPYDALAVELAPQLAALGFAVLSLGMRRRGMEGQLMTMPDDDLVDIKLAVDYLHVNEFRQVYLLGDGVGGSGALDYMARHKDTRVKGLAWINPMDHLPDWLRTQVGDENYSNALRLAGIAARQGAGMDMRIDLFPRDSAPVTQQAMAFLSTWGPMAGRSLPRNLEDSHVPLLAIAPKQDAVPERLVAHAKKARNAEIVIAEPEECASALISWAKASGAEMPAACPAEMVHVSSAGAALFGLLWKPADDSHATVTLLMHGLTSSPLSPLFMQMAPLLAKEGSAVLAVESRRSGWAGHESSVLDNDLEDLDEWVGFLKQQGYKRIVLAGASMGSLSIGRFQSIRQHPDVVALAHLMPTADCPDWFRRATGDGPYAEAVAQAQQAVKNGEGATTLIDVDTRQPPPNRYGGRFRWTQRAASWLSWWGPEADSRNSVHIANAKVPVLLLSGTEDSYNDEARFAELKAAAVNAPSVDEIWYPDIDHGLARVEKQVARDMAAWMKKTGVL